ncbi:pentatricopeptide repeat-containing protein 3, mitochondrial [Lingula anatina]|uniref:Small ribosomal subunit protein mS39 n=1 Tax=Lingula anatina TaxID=7574 RepID=A0A1S3KD96_LINAN|nr:pentatricopeptide repeat-containing protein 3, mitochondrial [Lingula anatina]|eukprot:XP_013420231.1 pentatricopeptide repeat-containing protein 3, mitochondrial [Lingula anatina]
MIFCSTRFHRHVSVKLPASIRWREKLAGHYEEDIPFFTQEELSAPKAVETVNPPNKVPRDELSILQALNSTVEIDWTAPRYDMIDHPKAAPFHPVPVKKNELSKAAGKAAARWFLSNNKNVMRFNAAEPPIKEFHYKSFEPGFIGVALRQLKQPENYGKVKHIIANTKNKSGNPLIHPDRFEEEIKGFIEHRQYKNAFTMFKIYQYCAVASAEDQPEGFRPISQECFNRLLDAMALHTGHDPLRVPKDPSEIYYGFRGVSPFYDGKKWKQTNAAHFVFENMPEKNAWAYNSMLMGMLTHKAYDEAQTWVTAMRDKNIPVELECYNGLIDCIQEKSDLAWEMVKKLLQEMAKADVRPNLITFNNALRVLVNSKDKLVIQHIDELLGEMKAMDIEPSLATWDACLVHVYLKKGSKDIGYLKKIFDSYIKGRQFLIRDPEDFQFFTTAMNSAYLSNSLTLANEINETVEIGKNHYLLGNQKNTIKYYYSYFDLLLKHETIDVLMEFYVKYSPYRFVLNAYVVAKLLTAVKDQQSGFQHILRLLEDARTVFPRTFDVPLLALKIVKDKAMKKNCNSKMRWICANVGWEVLDWYDIGRSHGLYSLSVEQIGSDIVSDCLFLLLNNSMKDVRRSWPALQIGMEVQAQTGKKLRESVVEKMGRACIVAEEPKFATECLDFMYNNKCLGTAKMAEAVLELRKEEDDDEFPPKEKEKVQAILKQTKQWTHASRHLLNESEKGVKKQEYRLK